MDLLISWITRTFSTALERWTPERRTPVDSESAKPPKRYLNRATECLKQAQRMISGSDGSPSVKVFRMQCDYLVQKLELAVNDSNSNSALSREHKSRHHEIPKLLYWLAIQVHGFVDDCCKDEHMHAALTAALVPMRVGLLGYQLELCRTVLSGNIDTLSAAGLASLRAAEQHEVERRPSRDEANFLDSSRSLIELGKSSNAQAELLNTLKSSKADQNIQLATMVQKRLDVASQAVLSTSFPSISFILQAWKVDGKSLHRIKELGTGATATVHKSEWLGAVMVAEKVFPIPSNVKFEEEISLLATLSHPSIVSILGYWTDEKSSAIVTELMDGDLYHLMAERLKRGTPGMRPFSISVACDTMLQVAEGVRYIHEKGVSHRDLKSENILVRRSKDNDIEYVCAKVADFGLSKTKESTLACTHQTSNMGTWRFRAPEMIGPAGTKITESDKLHPFRSDVYSFGMLCFEILTGELPFSDKSIPSEVNKLVNKGTRPELPPECPEELRSLIKSCWRTDPDERPHMPEVCKKLWRIKYTLLLDDFKSDVTVSAPPPRLVHACATYKREKWYLDRIKQCMKHVQQMNSGPLFDSTGVKMYHRQCQFLEDALKLAIEVCFQSSGQLGILRLLLVLAIQIKGFIEDCCSKEWVKIALISPSVVTAPSVTVSSLGLYLKYVMSVNSNVSLGSTQLESWREDIERAVAEEAGLDEQNLLNALQSLVVSSTSSSWEDILSGSLRNADRIQLATILQKKLEARLSVSTRSSQVSWTYLKTDPSTIKLKETLGKGASATTSRGIWFGAEVAVKTYYGGTDVSFQKEVLILGNLCHPNIVNILGYSHDDEKSYILMNLMDTDLNSFIARRLDRIKSRRDMRFPFDIDVAVDLMLQVANGVNYLHEHEIVHRNLKPSKILVNVTRSEEYIPELLCVKVAGFGLPATERTLTFADQFVMTRWNAPEQWMERAGGTYGGTMKSDVYSFGLLCYQILTGEMPFTKIPLPDLKETVMLGERPELPLYCPSELKTLIQACWHHDPSHRPSSREICKELRSFKYTLLLKETSGDMNWQYHTTRIQYH